jgi:hypothetical protein
MVHAARPGRTLRAVHLRLSEAASMEESQAIRRIRQILGCYPPWYLAKFTAWFDPVHVVHVALLHEPQARWRCPRCDLELECCGHAEERLFLCLDTDAPKAHVRVKPPYVFCPVHGLQLVTLHWAEDPTRWKAVALAPSAEDSPESDSNNMIH